MNQITATILEDTTGSPHDKVSASWTEFTAAADDDTFCRAWLALQCTMITGVSSGLLLLRDTARESYVPAAVWPDLHKDVSYLGQVAEKALTEQRGTVLGLGAEDSDGIAANMVHVAYPFTNNDEVAGVVALELQTRSEGELQDILRQLLWGAGWLESMFRRHQSVEDFQVLERAATGLDLIQSVQEHTSVSAAAIALVNELATQMGADRVSLGLETKGKLSLRAISRTAWFDRKSQVVEALENAIEEAMDQGCSLVFPSLPGERGRIIVAQRDLALRSGADSILTVPLVSGGRPIGAITLERDRGPLFSTENLHLLEVVGELVGPALHVRLAEERFISGKAVDKLLSWREQLFGPRRPGVKMAAIAAMLVVVFLVFAEGDFRITARTVIEGQMQRAAVAPFDGYVSDAQVRAGDIVSKGEILALLDDREIKLELARWQSETEQTARKYREALANRDATAARIFEAQQGQAAAQLALAEEKLARTKIVAPLDSIVVWGDLSQMIGAPVERGKVLFELAPLGAYRVILQVDDRDIGYIHMGQSGNLALAGLAESTLPFVVKSVTSVSTPEEGRNYFRVEAEISDVPERLRPGMEGVGKIYVEERKLVWVWTRNFMNWLRIALWNWLP
jgi:GAF domain-containing protein